MQMSNERKRARGGEQHSSVRENSREIKSGCSIFSPFLGPYDFCDAENADGIAESSHKNGIYSLTWNVTEFVKVWMN